MGVLVTITTMQVKCQIAQSHYYGCVRHGEILNAIIILTFYQSRNFDLMLIYVLCP